MLHIFDLSPELSLLLIISLLTACAFEFINGFHDTANAVATVIYTNSLKPWIAVIWSGFWNFLGVFAGGIGVAMGIVYILPLDVLVDENMYHGISMIMSILLSAIFWNLLTWYLGIPCSSSHTLIGSILGVGIAYSLIAPDLAHGAVNWRKAEDIGLSLLISPIFGFSLTIFLIFLLRKSVDNKIIFHEPPKHKAPPLWIRSILILTCTGVSFFHGSNDGQKGVGLIMLILICLVPSYFAVDLNKNLEELQRSSKNLTQHFLTIPAEKISAAEQDKRLKIINLITHLEQKITEKTSLSEIKQEKRIDVRNDILNINKAIEVFLSSNPVALSPSEITEVKAEVVTLKKFTDFSPMWVIAMVSVSLGLGTMIGWKRIVKTIGEKIGKQHLTYAQGASAELVAASTIGISTYLGLPVSTTHVLSSGIAGSMVASKGVKNLQSGTIKNIAIAWALTLPVSIFVSGGLFLLLRML